MGAYDTINSYSSNENIVAMHYTIGYTALALRPMVAAASQGRINESDSTSVAACASVAAKGRLRMGTKRIWGRVFAPFGALALLVISANVERWLVANGYDGWLVALLEAGWPEDALFFGLLLLQLAALYLLLIGLLPVWDWIWPKIDRRINRQQHQKAELLRSIMASRVELISSGAISATIVCFRKLEEAGFGIPVEGVNPDRALWYLEMLSAHIEAFGVEVARDESAKFAAHAVRSNGQNIPDWR
jgi:hypothetical protein